MKENNPFSLQGKVAVVTGAAAGIGKACAQRMAYSGASVLLSDIDVAACQRLAAELNEQGFDARAIQQDVVLEEDWQALVAELKQWHNRWDILVNNASSFYPTPLAEANIQQWNELFGSNVQAAYFLCQAFASSLSERKGCILNITDIHAEKPFPEHSIYGMAKAALLMMNRVAEGL